MGKAIKILIGTVLLFGIAGGCLGATFLLLPDPRKLLGEFDYHPFNASEAKTIRVSPKSNGYTPLDQISPYLVGAVLISEDAGFFQHSGFDFFEMKRAIRADLRKGRLARGASTISQQLVKNLYLSGEKTFWRKFQEALLTIKLETYLKKKKILELYLNLIEWGPDIYGITKASAFYFNKKPSKLLPAEAAFLTALIPNPQRYCQDFFSKQLSKRVAWKMGWVLKWMREREIVGDMDYMFASTIIENPSLLFETAQAPSEEKPGGSKIDFETLLENEPETTDSERFNLDY